MTRDQVRAATAYELVGTIKELGSSKKSLQENYRTLINGLGANIMRNGLAAALAFIERYHDKDAARTLRTHLAAAQIPGLKGPEDKLGSQVRGLPLREYMLATRETLKVIVWFKRAVQAKLSAE